MTKAERKELKIKCELSIASAKAKGRTIIKSICPNCYETLESILSPKATWSAEKSDIITKACFECGQPHILKMNSKTAKSHNFYTEKIIHIYKQ